MFDITQKTREITGLSLDSIPYGELLDAGEPVILKGVANSWPLVVAGQTSAKEAMRYMQGFDAGRELTMYMVPAEAKGRIFYNEELTGFNFQHAGATFDDFIEAVCSQLSTPNPISHYVGSRDADIFFPGLRKENDLRLAHPMFEHGNLLASVWMGSKTTVAAHYDMSNNMACCMVGKRRFTLFPPAAVHGLYPGPLEPTPGGQAMTMVDFHDPDHDKYPNFKDALATAQVAELEPGDVLFFPALWWHHVEALSDFNIMMNYWWNDAPTFLDNPNDTLLHGMLSLRDRPKHEKKAWQELFNYYVFGPSAIAAKHLPKAAQGALGPMDDMKARRLRAQLLQRLNC
ncbi:MAG: cupin-like domain-containing protein [Kordiimonadaceae bacterium]|nr:cupin-like domain-containing protein [Kordiimonadaceae bacterium]